VTIAASVLSGNLRTFAEESASSVGQAACPQREGVEHQAHTGRDHAADEFPGNLVCSSSPSASTQSMVVAVPAFTTTSERAAPCQFDVEHAPKGSASDPRRAASGRDIHW
jgi:hypothetical protein